MPDRPGVVSLLLKIGRHLQTGDPAATIDRLFNSKHVKDLQLIVAVALAILALVFAFGLPSFVGNELVNPAPNTVTGVRIPEQWSGYRTRPDGAPPRPI